MGEAKRRSNEGRKSSGRKRAGTDSSILRKVNEVQVTADLLGEVLEMHADMAPEDRPVFEARAIRLFELLDRKGLHESRALISMAVDFRLTALAKLHGQGKVLRGWTMPGDVDGMSYLNSDVLKAVAEEPLVEDSDGEAIFDPDSFQRRVLACAETSGEGLTDSGKGAPRRWPIQF